MLAPMTAPGHSLGRRPWDAVTRTIDGGRILGVPLTAAVSAGVLVVGSFLTAAAATARDPVTSILVAGVGAVATGLLAALTNAYARPPAFRRAFEAFVFLGEFELDRVARLGDGRLSPTIGAMERYVATAPERAGDRWLRVEFLGKRGDIETAREMAGRMPDSTAWERMERGASLAWVDWLEGGPGDTSEIRRLVAQIDPHDSDERLRAEVVLACAELRERLANGDADPAGPLETVRDRLGSHADGVLRKMARRAAPAFVRVAVAIVAILLVLDRLVGR